MASTWKENPREVVVVSFVRIHLSSANDLWTIRNEGVPGMYVDIVKDVINSTAVYWAAERLVIICFLYHLTFGLS